jgi:hypothetical protein
MQAAFADLQPTGRLSTETPSGEVRKGQQALPDTQTSIEIEITISGLGSEHSASGARAQRRKCTKCTKK